MYSKPISIPDKQSVSSAEHEKQESSESVSQFKFDDYRPVSFEQKAIQKMANDKMEVNPPAVAPVQKKSNGLPQPLRNGIENLSGMSMEKVNVHYNSSKPAQLQALAYAQGNNIHLGPGQEKHLPHEAWHVVQQKQGRVKPTIQMKTGTPINDDPGLEKEADTMGAKALQAKFSSVSPYSTQAQTHKSYHQSFSMAPVQRLIGFEIEAQYLPVTPYSAAAEPSVTNLLARGVPFSYLGAKNATWYRETDHGLIGRLLNTERKNWQAIATANKKDLDRVNKNAAHIEYVTAPFDETRNATYNPGFWARRAGYSTIYGLNQMAATITDIKNQIALYQAAAATTQVGQYQIGVPSQAAFDAAATHYGIDVVDPNFAKNSRTTIVNAVKTDKTYVQATVGVLPEKIIQFLQKAADGNQAYNKRSPVSAQDPLLGNNPHNTDEGKAYRLIGTAMNRIDMNMTNFINRITAKNGIMPTTVAAERTALKGYLTLVLHVTLGSVIRQARSTGGVPKNMVSFLPKTSLNIIPNAMPWYVNTTKISAAKRTELINDLYDQHDIIAQALQGVDNAITGAMIDGTAGGGPLTVPVKQYMQEVLSGQQDRFFTTQSAGRPALQPEAPHKGGREGINTRNYMFNAKTRAIALETRHYAKLISANDLPNYANDMKDLMLDAHV